MRDKKDRRGSSLGAFYIHGRRYSAQVPIGGARTCARGPSVKPLGCLVCAEVLPQKDINVFSYALYLSASWESQRGSREAEKASCHVTFSWRCEHTCKRSKVTIGRASWCVMHGTGEGREGGRGVRGREGYEERQRGRQRCRKRKIKIGRQ